jgi:hypothetical protein
MRKIFYALPVLAALAALAACGSSGTSASSSSSAATRSGTETISATSTNPNATTVTVHASGVAKATGTFKLPHGNGTAVVHFVFPDGTLTANASRSRNTATHLNPTTCAAAQVSGGTYTISPSGSTGTYAGATGHGNFAASFGAKVPKLSDGKCNMSSSVQPVKGTVHVTVLVRGPLTLKH